MKIVTIVGARPQFVKAAVVSRAIQKWNYWHKDKLIEEIIIHTGQHYDNNMSEVFFAEMCIPKPKYNLHIGGGTHGAMTGQMLEKIEEVLLAETPEAVLVYGDTNSTLAGALAASKLHIPVAHVEAGLRSFNMDMPEEINRILTDRISKWLFCPTHTAEQNLIQEGFSHFSANCIYTGDVMQDAAIFYSNLAKPTEKIASKLKGKFYLATVHRAENTDVVERIQGIMDSLNTIAKNTPLIMPVHPRTRKILNNLKINASNITMIDPVGYFDMVCLLKNCTAVFTDSGGVQKEAYFFSKPCITLREETEWVELVDNGFNQLVGATKEKILAAEKNLLASKMDFSKRLYGEGNAGEKIIRILI